MDEKAKLIIHPVRMRIVQTFIGGQKLTVQEIQEKLKDVPQATLYRNLNKLVKGGVLEVAATNQVRGTIEKVYELVGGEAGLSAEEFQNSSREEQMGVFMRFVGNLIDQFGRYLDQDEIDLVKDGVTMRQVELYLDEKEYLELMKSVAKLYQEAMKNKPEGERRKRFVTTIVVPEVLIGKEKSHD
ncbi:helix-turn-helix domain-containing protein [Ectobacillus sp. JY-23]|uniref:helix-turn-helix domain-containing protein n=1 Tax=Ectobacillus sp. JY-23 TaxID=2933872 RepID=UPI001FF6C680|nr:helix-turn-helix domain-containing protein [Ectobacillus sp. JY-23]UOY91625.1 helix-turn-helix domain-containing protein [Ectobacillus sp. JY-23]